MEQNDIYFMECALEEARIALEEDEVPVGCVLVCENQIIAKGHNTKEKEKCIIHHAEINCIIEGSKQKGNYNLSNCVLYVTLEPCPMCAAAIQQAKIKRIVYGADDSKNGACGGLYDFFLIPKLNYYPLITSKVLEEPCKKLLKEYFKEKRKK